MTCELLVAFAAFLLENKNLVSPASVINDRCLYYSAFYIRGTNLDLAIFIDKKHLLEHYLGILGCLEAVHEDFISRFYLELLACNIYNCVHKNKKT